MSATSPTVSFAWAEPQLRPPLAHERKFAPRKESVLVAPDGTPVADASPDDLALRPSIALLQVVQAGLRAGAVAVLKRLHKGRKP